MTLDQALHIFGIVVFLSGSAVAIAATILVINQMFCRWWTPVRFFRFMDLEEIRKLDSVDIDSATKTTKKDA